MASSQFTIYTASDTGGPGPINGLAGSLLTVLNACLVNGYTGKAAAGWTKPLGQTGSLAAYTPASGSRMTLFVNDMAPNPTQLGVEAWVVGWESMTSLTSSTTQNMSCSVGAGYGQFPTPVQMPLAIAPELLTVNAGHLVWRKAGSFTTPRYWIMFADASTMYLFIQAGDAAHLFHFSVDAYYASMFGDIYSLKQTSDVYRCFLFGRTSEAITGFGYNSAGNTANNDTSDRIHIGDAVSAVTYAASPGYPMALQKGNFMARPIGGVGSSVNVSKFFDVSKSNTTVGNTTSNFMVWWSFSGIMQTPNSSDNSYYLSPVSVGDEAWSIRGRLRGMYVLSHPYTSFSDGQVFSGAGDYAGKTFQIVKPGTSNGCWAIEISNTVETN